MSKKTNRIKQILLIIISGLLLLGVISLFWGISKAVSDAESDGHVFPVYITEIVSSNSRYPNEYGLCSDYIEIYNSADYEIDITHFQISDGGNSVRYVFPEGTIIAPDEYIVVYCDGAVDQANYAGFGISREGGESIYLLTSKGVVIDTVETIALESNQAMACLDNNQWIAVDRASPGYSNSEAPDTNASYHIRTVSPVRINEMMSGNTMYPDALGEFNDWIELYNTGNEPVNISGYSLSDNVDIDKYIFPEGTVIPANGYLIVYCSDTLTNKSFAPFKLSKIGGEIIILKTPEGLMADIVDSVALDENCTYALNRDSIWHTMPFGSPGYSNDETGYDAYLKSIGHGERSVVISEVMASNETTILDNYSEFSDWIELCNISNQTVNLEGWFLSDSEDNPYKWEFPACTIAPGEYIIVFCSGRDTVVDNEIHTGFSLSSSGETLTLSSPLGITMDTVAFHTTGSDQTVCFDHNSSGSFVSTFPTPGLSNDEENHEVFCASHYSKGPLAIWEIMPSNDTYMPQADGKCYDWVEIKNISDKNVNLSRYSISDDYDAPDMFVLPDITLAPGETFIVIMSGNPSLSTARYTNAGFKLSALSETLFLCDSAGGALDYVKIENVPNAHSYGRSATLGGFFYMSPTPGEENGECFRKISDTPQSNIEAGVHIYNTPVAVQLSSSGSIYYTLDGSDPSIESNRYSGSINISTTSILRAISVENGKLQSSIYTASFIINQEHAIPVVSLVTDPDNLWGRNGIYKDSNKTKEMKRTANLAYTGTDGSFSLDCEISMHGATSLLAQPKKSFTVRFRNNYDGLLNYDIFEDGRITSFSSIILRADQESTYSSYMRDNLFGYVGSYYSEHLITQNTKYVALYLNGEYWGIYSIREHHSEEHYSAHMDVPVDSVQMVKYYMTEHDELHGIFLYCQNNNLSSNEKYEYVASKLDIDSFIDWIIFEAYTGNFDIHGNMRYYYCSLDGLWRCGLNDVDLGMFSHECFPAVIDAFHHGHVVSALFQNEQFQEKLLIRLAELLSGPMSDENMMATIDMLAAKVRGEVPLEKERWGGSTKQWEEMITSLTNFCDGRAEEMVDSICSVLHLSAAEREYYFGELDL